MNTNEHKFWGEEGATGVRGRLAAGRGVLMGVVNVTPDSFSDGNQFLEAGAAIGHGKKLIGEGAEILDLGAEASSFFRAGVVAVEAGEQWRRLEKVIEGLRGCGVVMSIDTRSAEVARRAVETVGKNGWAVINDVSAGRHDAGMLKAVAELGAAVVLMHMGAEYPKTPARDEGDIVGSVMEYLQERCRAAERAGVRGENIWVDPGIGFGKTMADNWRLVAGIERIAAMGRPVVLGVSRKRFLETERPEGLDIELETRNPKPETRMTAHLRDEMTGLVTAWVARRVGVIHRVHDVGLARRAMEGVGE